MHKREIKKLTSQRDYHKAQLVICKEQLSHVPAHSVLAADYWRKKVIGHKTVMELLNRQLGRHV